MSEVGQWRLVAQHIAGSALDRPEDVVASMAAIQAQDFRGSLWAIALRTRGHTTADDVVEAMGEGRIVRTHASIPSSCWTAG